MVTFRSNNNNRRSQFRTNNSRRPSFRSNNDVSKFSNSDNFQRRVPSRNNHNAPKLIEKYNDLAREALANEDKILSENYFQHADHFTRVQNEQENFKKARISTSSIDNTKSEKINISETKEAVSEPEAIKNVQKTVEQKTSEKKSAVS